jgi:hypothetical protein
MAAPGSDNLDPVDGANGSASANARPSLCEDLTNKKEPASCLAGPGSSQEEAC